VKIKTPFLFSVINLSSHNCSQQYVPLSTFQD
jgi:hypothetical protein